MATEIGFGLALDAGGLYVAGRSHADASVWKFDLAGNVIWTRHSENGVVAAAKGVAAYGGFIYVAGLAQFDLDGPGPGIFAGGYDGFVQKYDPAGNVIWTRQFGTARHDGALAVDVDAGVVHVAGSTGSAFAGPYTVTGLPDAFARTYDLDGNLSQVREFGSAAFDEASGIDLARKWLQSIIHIRAALACLD